jgi:hypothetical protein
MVIVNFSYCPTSTSVLLAAMVGFPSTGLTVTVSPALHIELAVVAESVTL